MTCYRVDYQIEEAVKVRVYIRFIITLDFLGYVCYNDVSNEIVSARGRTWPLLVGSLTCLADSDNACS